MKQHRYRLALAIGITLLGALVLSTGACSKNESRTVKAPTAQPLRTALERGLLLVRDQQLLVRDMAAGTEYEVKRTPSAGIYYNYPRWSPDGRQFAYVLTTQYDGSPNQSWGADVLVSASDGSNERVVLKRPGPGWTIQGLDWAPDGSALFVGVLATTIQDGRYLGQTLSVERLDLATGALTRLATGALYPAVSPDGQRIAFVTEGTASVPGGLWTALSDGTDARLLVPVPGQFLSIIAPNWSPDSRRIAFSATLTTASDAVAPGRRQAWRWPWQPRAAAAHGLPRDIWQVAAEGGTPERLTTLTKDDLYFAWSADGKELALLSADGLYRMPVNGSEPLRIDRGALEAQMDWR